MRAIYDRPYLARNTIAPILLPATPRTRHPQTRGSNGPHRQQNTPREAHARTLTIKKVDRVAALSDKEWGRIYEEGEKEGEANAVFAVIDGLVDALKGRPALTRARTVRRFISAAAEMLAGMTAAERDAHYLGKNDRDARCGGLPDYVRFMLPWLESLTKQQAAAKARLAEMIDARSA